MKKEILHLNEPLPNDIINGTTEEVIQNFKTFHDKLQSKLLENNYSSFKFTTTWYDEPYFFIQFFRYETDQEYQDRLDLEDRIQLEKTVEQRLKDQQEWTLYQKLKKKFDK